MSFRFSFFKVTNLIGRNALQVDFYIDSNERMQSHMISRCHARVVRQQNNDHKLFDDSLNGIFVNHIKIRGINDFFSLNEQMCK